MRIGPVEFASPFLLAPLAGVSDSPFRQLAREQGAAGVYSEMVSADGLVRRQPGTLEYLRFTPAERPFALQLFGSEPGVLADAVRLLGDLPPAERPDLVDLNAGCPVRKVVNRRAGAALLTDLPRLAAILRAMATASPLPVTVKLRLGWDSRSAPVTEIARVAEDAGAQAITLHPRTRAEGFGGRAHWESIGVARQAVGIPVIGNGDVRTADDALEMLETTGCDGVMLGRAAFGDPWVFRRVLALWERGEHLPPPGADERLRMGLRHLGLMVADVGAARAAREMRKHVAWYVKGLPDSARVRDQANHTRSVDEMAALLIGYLCELERRGPGPAAAVDRTTMPAAGDAGAMEGRHAAG